MDSVDILDRGVGSHGAAPQNGRDPIVVTTPDAVMQRLLPRTVVKDAMRYLVQGDEVVHRLQRDAAVMPLDRKLQANDLQCAGAKQHQAFRKLFARGRRNQQIRRQAPFRVH